MGSTQNEKTSTGVTADAAESIERDPSVIDEAALFASPLPITGERKVTTRKEIWVRGAHRAARQPR
jgi:hypothetical protein